MMSCICGSPVDGNGSLCRRCAALAVLELKAGATEQEIKSAYRVMVKVWHPDRFPGDAPLQKTAEAKLKKINAAVQFLNSPASRYVPPQPAAPVKTQAQAPPEAQAASSGTREPHWQTTPGDQKQASSAYRDAAAGEPKSPAPEGPPKSAQQHSQPRPAAGPKQRRAAARWPRRAMKLPIYQLKIALRWMALGVVLLLARYAWIAFDSANDTREQIAREAKADPGDLWSLLELPRERAAAAVRRDLRALGFRWIDPHPAPADPDENSRGARGMATPRSGRRAAGAGSQDPGHYPFITIGTTRDEVLEDLGVPSAVFSDKLVYGRSELHFRGDSVVGWRIDPDTSPIRVKLWPSSFVDPAMKTFTAGSTKDEVLAVQGTPTALSEDEFEYGNSLVYFRNDRVIAWRNDLASIPLRLAVQEAP